MFNLQLRIPLRRSGPEHGAIWRLADALARWGQVGSPRNTTDETIRGIRLSVSLLRPDHGDKRGVKMVCQTTCTSLSSGTVRSIPSWNKSIFIVV
jgi:hypothetical protein